MSAEPNSRGLTDLDQGRNRVEAESPRRVNRRRHPLKRVSTSFNTYCDQLLWSQREAAASLVTDRPSPAGAGSLLRQFDRQQLLGLPVRQLCAAAGGGRIQDRGWKGSSHLTTLRSLSPFKTDTLKSETVTIISLFGSRSSDWLLRLLKGQFVLLSQQAN